METNRLYRHNVDGAARFLTFSCEKRLPFFSNEKIAELFVERLREVSVRHRVAVLAWVVIPEHVHLVVFPGTPMIEDYLVDLKSPFARKVIKRWRELDAPTMDQIKHADGPRFWQSGGGYDRAIVGDELLEKIRHTHQNPIRRGLCMSSIDYRWSSARSYEGRSGFGPAIAMELLPRDNPGSLT